MRAAKQSAASAPAAEPQPQYVIVKQTRSRWWEVRDPAGELVCLTVSE